MRRAHLATALAAVATVFVYPQLANAAPADDEPAEAAPAAPAPAAPAPSAPAAGAKPAKNGPAAAPDAPSAPAPAPAAPSALALDASRPVQCLTDSTGTTWRVQCDEEHKICARSPSREKDEDGEWSRPLERVRPCDAAGDLETIVAGGYQIVDAAPDTPRGWKRDERGRVFQVTFDLHRRLYAGVAWSPSLRDAAGESADAGRMRLDFGLLEYEATTGTTRAGFRHRLHLVEGDVQLAPFRADATLVHYDFSRRSEIPLVRITTFWGTPRRHDIAAHMGGWFELGHLQVDDVAPGTTESLWRVATAHLTWDLWRTNGSKRDRSFDAWNDMSSFLRLRGGVGAERAVTEGEARPDRDAVTPAAAVDMDLSLDGDGFHHLTGTFQLERPQFVGDARDLRKSATRAQAKLAYEVIVVAINDQPLTLRVAGEAEYRNDIPDVPAGWDLRAVAGVRLSLWAPAR